MYVCVCVCVCVCVFERERERDRERQKGIVRQRFKNYYQRDKKQKLLHTHSGLRDVATNTCVF